MTVTMIPAAPAATPATATGSADTTPLLKEGFAAGSVSSVMERVPGSGELRVSEEETHQENSVRHCVELSRGPCGASGLPDHEADSREGIALVPSGNLRLVAGRSEVAGLDSPHGRPQNSSAAPPGIQARSPEWSKKAPIICESRIL